MPGHISQSTLKPKLFSERSSGDVIGFDPVSKEAFYHAHDKNYVDSFFSGIEPFASSSGFDWNTEYAESQKYTVGSLFAAISHVVSNGGMAVSPVSGFHHATPKCGKMFCAFSGQVVASALAYKQNGLRGAYVDLDSHYGNSIDDTIRKDPSVKSFIKFNVNPKGAGNTYIRNLVSQMKKIQSSALAGDLDYLVYCHGADSIVGDPLGHQQLTVDEWFDCTRIVGTMCKESNIPIVMCLFGGYGDMDKIVELHIKDAELLNEIIG